MTADNAGSDEIPSDVNPYHPPTPSEERPDDRFYLSTLWNAILIGIALVPTLAAFGAVGWIVARAANEGADHRRHVAGTREHHSGNSVLSTVPAVLIDAILAASRNLVASGLCCRGICDSRRFRLATTNRAEPNGRSPFCSLSAARLIARLRMGWSIHPRLAAAFATPAPGKLN